VVLQGSKIWWSTNCMTANFYKYCTNLSQNSPKSCPLFFLLCTHFNESDILRKKKYVFAEVSSPQITKRLGTQIANPPSVTFAKVSNCSKLFNLRICDLRNLFVVCLPLELKYLLVYRDIKGKTSEDGPSL
jgi:hypothetical protein